MKYLWTEDTGAGLHFWQFSTERVMKSLAGELTDNEDWTIKGKHMGTCWYNDCCTSNHQGKLRCGKPEVVMGMRK